MTGLQLYIDSVVFVFGAVIGSFLNVCIYRMPLDQSVVTPPSHCPHCNQGIRWIDNIPLISYLALGRKCRHCGTRISPRYFLVELLTAILFLLIWISFKDSHPVLCPIYWLLLGGLIAGSFIDLEHYIIPNELTLGGIVVGFLASVAVPSLQHTQSNGLATLKSLAGILVGGIMLYMIAEMGKLLFGRYRVELPPDTTITIADGKLKLPDEELPLSDLFSRESDKIRFIATTLRFADKEFHNVKVIVRENTITVDGADYPLTVAVTIEATTHQLILPREAMGMGDVKLLAAIGAFLGWQATLFSVFLSAAAGSIVSLAFIAVGKKDFQSRIPYGPYIALGAIVWVFAQDRLLAIIAGYLGNMKDFLTIVFGRG